MNEIRKKWCRVTRICKAVIFGYTPDNELVLMTATYGNMLRAEVGDIVEFIPGTPRPSPHAQAQMWRPAKYYGGQPHIIARAVQLGVTGDDIDARAWARANELAASEAVQR